MRFYFYTEILKFDFQLKGPVVLYTGKFTKDGEKARGSFVDHMKVII